MNTGKGRVAWPCHGRLKVQCTKVRYGAHVQCFCKILPPLMCPYANRLRHTCTHKLPPLGGTDGWTDGRIFEFPYPISGSILTAGDNKTTSFTYGNALGQCLFDHVFYAPGHANLVCHVFDKHIQSSGTMNLQMHSKYKPEIFSKAYSGKYYDNVFVQTS